MSDGLSCPVCHKGKFLAVSNPKGLFSVKCAVCKRIVILDWNKMSAEESKPIKDAYKQVSLWHYTLPDLKFSKHSINHSPGYALTEPLRKYLQHVEISRQG